MSAVLKAREPSAGYLDAVQPTLVRQFALLATAPAGVVLLRELILTLAVQGKLLSQDAGREAASALLQEIASKKEQLILAGRVKPDKDDLPIDLQSIPFDLPSEWSWVRLGSIGSIGSSCRVHQSDWRNSGVPFYRAREIVKLSRAGVVANELFIAEELFESLAKRGWVPEPDDIMITGVGTIGVPYIVRRSDRFYFKDASVIIFKNHFELNPDYLALVFRSPYWIDSIHEESMGTTVHTLTISRASSALIPLPPRIEQARIVARVDELMRLCDALEAKGRLEAAQHAHLLDALLRTLTDSTTPEELATNWQRVAKHFNLLLDRPEAVDALEQTILRLAVRGLLVPQDSNDEPANRLVKATSSKQRTAIELRTEGVIGSESSGDALDPLPAGWEHVELRQVADARLGKMLDKAKNRGLPKPYLRNTNVQWRRFDLDDIKLMNIEESELAEFRLIAGDLLICEGGEPGRCAIWRDDARELYFQKAIHRVRPRAGVSADYIAVVLERDALSGALSQYFTGATIKHFVGQALSRYVFPLPPSAEQTRIVARVNQLRGVCTDLRQRLASLQSIQFHLADVLVEQAAA